MAILSIGFSCFDQFFFLNEWPQENTKNFCHDFIESGGGPAANAAWLLGLWGEDVYYIGHLNQYRGQRRDHFIGEDDLTGIDARLRKLINNTLAIKVLVQMADVINIFAP